ASPTSRRSADLLRQVGFLDPGTIVVCSSWPVRPLLAQFPADRSELLAQQEFLLLLVHALADVFGDLVVDLHFGQMLVGPIDQYPHPPRDTTGASAPDLSGA